MPCSPAQDIPLVLVCLVPLSSPFPEVPFWSMTRFAGPIFSMDASFPVSLPFPQPTNPLARLLEAFYAAACCLHSKGGGGGVGEQEQILCSPIFVRYPLQDMRGFPITS